MRVENILQTVPDDIIVSHLINAVANLARLRVIVPDTGPDTLLLFHLRGIIVETHQLRLSLAIRTGINILQQGFIGRDEEAIVGIERVQIDVVLQLLNTPVHDTHGLINQCGERHTHVCRGRIDRVRKIDGTIAAKPHRIDGSLLHTHRVVGIVQDILELRRYRTDKRAEHVIVYQLGHHVIGHVVPGTVIVAQNLTCSLVPVLLKSLVAGHHHHGHVALHHNVAALIVQTCIIGIPLGVELQLSVDGCIIGSVINCIAILRLQGEETLLENRINLGVIQVIILRCRSLIQWIGGAIAL